jgi:hypothetical protein
VTDDQAHSKRLPGLQGIEVPEAVAEAVALPEDLDADAVGEYFVPDVARRRQAGIVYLVGAGIVAAGVLLGLPAGMWLMAGILAAAGAYHFVAGWHLEVREWQALQVANRATDFPVGHASAQLTFDGWRSRPVWNVLVFSADDPPSRRGLVRVDGITAEVVEAYVEAVPAEERA